MANTLKGEQVKTSKLTANLVEAMRWARMQGWSISRIAKASGVSRTQVWRIVHRQAWAHVL